MSRRSRVESSSRARYVGQILPLRLAQPGKGTGHFAEVAGVFQRDGRVRTNGFHQGDVVTAELVRTPVGDQERTDDFPFCTKGDTHDRPDALGCDSGVAGLQMRFGLVHQVVGALGGASPVATAPSTPSPRGMRMSRKRAVVAPSVTRT